MLLVILGLYLACPGAALAQTIRPLVSEFQKEARGRMEVVNDSDQPLTVVIEPRGFSLTDSGELRDEPLPAGITVKLSAMSFRLPPRQSRFVFYEASAEQAPAWFILFANFTGYPSRSFSGLNVQLELPHVVYILPRERWKADDLRVVSRGVEKESGVLTLAVENQGPYFGRIAELEVEGERQKGTVRGFPLLPGGRRLVEIAWKGDDTPETVILKTGEFSSKRTLTPDR
jgi:hypothetical protein